ncbi:unnamed protein product [Cylicostephanus goldi]|uniref:Uncharacterized protein n=1 Tax=Cylicostephanus goldi TaxID=71465 RepID=A0A3P7MQ22_CYLGO|nr:unnamed protein product [Cylicostephanus goldi]
MAVNISAELKRANETSLALDREQDALWQELSKYQMACTDDYTGEILFEQDRKQTESNELRYVALSKAQAHIKRLLESSSAIFETAKHGIQVLSDTVSYAEEEFTEYNRRIEEVKNRKKQALEAATCSIKQNETKIGNLHQKCSGKQGESSGMEKLSAILPELKVYPIKLQLLLDSEF